MKTLKQLKKMLDNVARRADDWLYKMRGDLLWLCVRDDKGNMVTLMDVYNEQYFRDESIADIIDTQNVKVYEEDMDADKNDVYKVCTRRAVKRLRRLEQKFKEWNDKRYYLECATEIVHDDGTPYTYCENELADITRSLAALGVSI